MGTKSKIALSLCLIVGLFFLSGCRTTYVPKEKTIYREVEKKLTDTIFKTDSVYVRDSVAISKYGDTVCVDRWHTNIKYRYIYKVRSDTVISKDTVKVMERTFADKGRDKSDIKEIVLLTVIVLVTLYLIIRKKHLSVWDSK